MLTDNPLLASKAMMVEQYADDVVYRYAALTELITTAGVYVVKSYIPDGQRTLRVSMASMNVVNFDELRSYVSEWLLTRYGGTEVTYMQYTPDQRASTEDRLYFTACITMAASAGKLPK